MDFITHSNFVIPSNFIIFRKPIYTEGVVVIESDDGTKGDYTHWLPLFKRLSRRYSDFIDDSTIVACTAVNTQSIGTSSIFLTVADLQELVKNKWEIISHGKYHIGLGAYPLTTGVSQGQTVIYAQRVSEIKTETGYFYQIADGVNVEIIKPIEVNSIEGYIVIESPLQNSYATESTKIQLTSEAMIDLLQGCIDQLLLWDIDCQNHTYTYHSGSQYFYNENSVQLVGNIFYSARGISGAVNFKNDFSKNPLKSLLNTAPSSTMQDIDNNLNQTVLNNGLFIFHGHGEKDAESLAKLEYLIDGAMQRGIRILTRTKAVEYIESLLN